MPLESAAPAHVPPSAPEPATVIDLRGTSAVGLPTTHVLEDPSGRRARYLAVAGRATGAAFLAWLALLLLGGIGLIPGGSVPFGDTLLPGPASREAPASRSRDLPAPSAGITAKRAPDPPASPERGTSGSEPPTADRSPTARRRSSDATGPAPTATTLPTADPAPTPAPAATPTTTTPAITTTPATRPTGSSGTAPGSGRPTGASGTSPGSGQATGSTGTAPGSGHPTGATGTAPGSGRTTGPPADTPR